MLLTPRGERGAGLSFVLCTSNRLPACVTCGWGGALGLLRLHVACLEGHVGVALALAENGLGSVICGHIFRMH